MSRGRTSGVRALCLLAIAAGAVGCDQGTKSWAVRTFDGMPGRSITVVDPWLELTLTYNRGTAFSLIRDIEPLRWLVALIAILVVAWLGWMFFRGRFDRRLDIVAIGCAAGGAIGNLYDRLFRTDSFGRHGVVDFIDVTLPGGASWPVFNVADALIAIGVGLLVLRMSRRVDPSNGPPQPSASPA